MEKELENPEKKKRRKQPSHPTKPSQPARPRHLTGRPRLSAAVLPHARPPSLACCLVGPPVGPSFLRSFALSLSVSRARFASAEPLPPRVPFSLFPPWACLVSSTFPAPAVFWRVRTRARRRISRPRCSPTRPAPLFRAPPVPRAHPSPHFARLHPLSRSAHAASHRRRPAPVFSAIQLAGDRSKPPGAPPRGETPVPMPNFLYCALCSSNFTFAGARPRWYAMLARWSTDLA
jgi:hypothetical protein